MAYTPMEEEPDFSNLQACAATWLTPQGYELFSGFGNRHGSWEATFSRQHGNITEFISLDLTSLSAPPVGRPLSYNVEVWIDAEQADKFCRRMVGQLSVTDDHLNAQDFLQKLSALLNTAASVGNNLTSADLDGTYSRGFMRP